MAKVMSANVNDIKVLQTALNEFSRTNDLKSNTYSFKIFAHSFLAIFSDFQIALRYLKHINSKKCEPAFREVNSKLIITKLSNKTISHSEDTNFLFESVKAKTSAYKNNTINCSLDHLQTEESLPREEENLISNITFNYSGNLKEAKSKVLKNSKNCISTKLKNPKCNETSKENNCHLPSKFKSDYFRNNNADNCACFENRARIHKRFSKD